MWISAGANTGFLIGGGANPGGAPTYKFAGFSQKLHEIKKILGPWGGGGGGAGGSVTSGGGDPLIYRNIQTSH